MMDKLLITGNTPPPGMAVAEVFPMIQFTGTVEISDRGVVVGMYERKRTEYQDIVAHFAASAPGDANAIIDVQVTTSTHAFDDVSYLYLTYIGTPVCLVSE